MALRKALLLTAAAMAVVIGALLPATAWPNPHVVGETDGWQLGVDYNLWATNYGPISTGEGLEFHYLEGDHNVVMVDKDGYDDCDGANSVQTWNSGLDLVQLPEAGTYYFICSMGDHCDQGMKFAITAI